LISIKEAQDQLQFSRFLDVIQFRAQRGVITNCFNKATESSKVTKKVKARREASSDLNTLNRHLERLNALTDEYKKNGDSQQAARIKAANTLLPVYRKELRKVLLEYLHWMHAIKKDSTFRKLMQTKWELKDTEGYNWLESTELAIDRRKSYSTDFSPYNRFPTVKTKPT